jgi:mannose-6-phosphate isomerase class I
MTKILKRGKCVSLLESTLSDGSKVFDVQIDASMIYATSELDALQGFLEVDQLLFKRDAERKL